MEEGQFTFMLTKWRSTLEAFISTMLTRGRVFVRYRELMMLQKNVSFFRRQLQSPPLLLMDSTELSVLLLDTHAH
jgi:hypothetical protein